MQHEKMVRILCAIYRHDGGDATPYVRCFLGMSVFYPICWLAASLFRTFRGDGWHSFYLNYLVSGELFLLAGFLLLHLYLISRYGWRKFFRLVYDTP